jgi:hypothetical protein
VHAYGATTNYMGQAYTLFEEIETVDVDWTSTQMDGRGLDFDADGWMDVEWTSTWPGDARITGLDFDRTGLDFDLQGSICNASGDACIQRQATSLVRIFPVFFSDPFHDFNIYAPPEGHRRV